MTARSARAESLVPVALGLGTSRRGAIVLVEILIRVGVDQPLHRADAVADRWRASSA